MIGMPHGLPAIALALTAVVVLPVLGAGCAPPDEMEPSTPAGSDATVTVPPPLVMPDVSGLPEPVQAQVRERHDAVRRAEDTGASAGARGTAYGELGLILMATRFYEAAETAFGHAQALAPRQMRWPYYLAQLYRTTGDQPRAVERFERAVELDPTYVAALVRLGELYLDEGRAEDAEPLFEQALAVEPASAPALSGIGRAALARGQTARAIEHLERALAVGPPAWDIHYNLATAYRDAGNPERAEEHLSQRGGDPPEPPDPLMRAYESLLRSPRAYETRGVAAMQDGRTAEAVEIFREGLAQTPDDASLHQQLGSALFASGDANGAAVELEAALRLDPTQARAHAGLGTLASMGGRQAEAIERFAAAVENDPDYVEARLGLVDAYRAAGRAAEALAELDRAVEIAPGFADVWLARGLMLVQLGRYREARDRLDEARAVHPRHAGLTDLLVRVLAASPDPAARDGRRALALAEPLLGAAPNPTLDATVAMALAAVGRYGEAAERQRRAIAAAEQAGFSQLARALAVTLALYEQGRPTRAPLGGPQPPP
ncbi:MAG: tetratricopeptide repeat protein [Acidobacteria bacterium]|nr:tetratricopeptide repeat protein [Acidobacteriota bacterium]